MTNLSIIPQINFLTENGDIKMTSLELVNVINNWRKQESEVTGEKYTELRHDNFMTKVPEVLGKNQCPKFLGDYKDSKNRVQRCYIFPERESCLMAMSYSYDLQAFIFDEFIKLKNQEKARIDARNKARLENPKMNTTLKEIRASIGKDTESKHYINEADMINKIVFGLTSKKFKEIKGLTKSDAIRDYLTMIQIKAIEELQNRNTVYIGDGMEYEDRKQLLISYFNKHFKQKILGA